MNQSLSHTRMNESLSNLQMNESLIYEWVVANMNKSLRVYE